MSHRDALLRLSLALDQLALIASPREAPWFASASQSVTDLWDLVPGEFVQKLNGQSTKTGTPASLVETDLATYTLPGGTIDTDGQSLRLTAWGLWAAGTDERRIRTYFGGTVLDNLLTRHDLLTAWLVKAHVLRDGTASQVYHIQTFVGYAPPVNYLWQSPVEGALTKDWIVDQILKVSGQNVGASTADTIKCNGFIVELL